MISCDKKPQVKISKNHICSNTNFAEISNSWIKNRIGVNWIISTSDPNIHFLIHHVFVICLLCMAYQIEPINSNHLKTWLFSSTKSFIMKNNWRCSICEKPNRKYVSKHIRYNSLGYKERKYNTLIFYHYIIVRSFFCITTTYYSVLHAMKTILTC